VRGRGRREREEREEERGEISTSHILEDAFPIRPLEISKSFVESFTNLWSFERLQNLQKVTNRHKLS
jgi:hypothetical protein